MKSMVLFVALGVALVAVAAALGGRPALIGGGIALLVQIWAVVLLKPVMKAPNPQFMARWLGGMGIRLLGLGAVIVFSATLPGLLAYIGVLLPLLFLETRFLK